MPWQRTVHLTIRGEVQNVWFRAWTRETAMSLGLIGWVRNRADGTVEAVAHGLPEAVEQFIAACHEGPPEAVVSAVEALDVSGPDVSASLPPVGFELRPEA